MTRQGMAENGGFCRSMWRKMAVFVGLYGTKWRTLSDCVAQNDGFCRNMAGTGWRIMADFVGLCGGKWRIMADYVIILSVNSANFAAVKDD